MIKLQQGLWRGAFLAILGECGNVTDACKAANVSRVTAYEHKKNDAAFAEEWEAALQQAADVLEREAWRRATEGVEEPQFFRGKVCGYVRKYSDLLLIFLMKACNPAKYREKVYLSPGELDKLIERELSRAKGDKPADESQAVN